MAKSQVIGLDIGTTTVRAAQIEFSGGSAARRGPATLVRYGEAPLPPGAVRDGEVADQELVARILRDLWTRLKFDSRDVVIGVGNQRVVVRDLAVPTMPIAEIRAALPFQVQELLPMSVDEALLDFLPVGASTNESGAPMTHGLLVAAVRDTVSANVLAVEAAGLRPVMVDLNALALLRAMTRGAHASRTVAFVDIGARVTDVMIASQGVPQFVRTLPTGGQDATDAVARALSISGPDAEAVKRQVGLSMAVPDSYREAAEAIATSTQSLVEAVRNTFVYFTSTHAGQNIEEIVLTGGGARLVGLGQYLATASRLPVSFGDPLEALGVAKAAGTKSTFTENAPLMALSLGLAHGVAA